jgi:hypothetical protein
VLLAGGVVLREITEITKKITAIKKYSAAFTSRPTGFELLVRGAGRLVEDVDGVPIRCQNVRVFAL